MISAHWHTLPIIVFAMFLIKNILTDTIKLGYLAGGIHFTNMKELQN